MFLDHFDRHFLPLTAVWSAYWIRMRRFAQIQIRLEVKPLNELVRFKMFSLQKAEDRRERRPAAEEIQEALEWY